MEKNDMTMFTVTGTLTNVFKTPLATNRDGEQYGGDYKIQLLGEIPLQNGETRFEMVDLKIQDPALYGDLKGSSITVPVGAVAMGKNNLVYFIPKGAKPS